MPKNTKAGILIYNFHRAEGRHSYLSCVIQYNGIKSVKKICQKMAMLQLIPIPTKAAFLLVCFDLFPRRM